MNWEKCIIDCGNLGGEYGWQCPACSKQQFGGFGFWEKAYKNRPDSTNNKTWNYGLHPIKCNRCGWGKKSGITPSKNLR